MEKQQRLRRTGRRRPQRAGVKIYELPDKQQQQRALAGDPPPFAKTQRTLNLARRGFAVPAAAAAAPDPLCLHLLVPAAFPSSTPSRVSARREIYLYLHCGRNAAEARPHTHPPGAPPCTNGRRQRRRRTFSLPRSASGTKGSRGGGPRRQDASNAPYSRGRRKSHGNVRGGLQLGCNASRAGQELWACSF